MVHLIHSVKRVLSYNRLSPTFYGVRAWKSYQEVYGWIIVRTFEICRASHVTKNLEYPCAKIRAVMNMTLSVFLVKTAKDIYYESKVY